MLPSEWHKEMAALDRQAVLRNMLDQSHEYRLPDDVTDVAFIEAWTIENRGTDNELPTQEEWDDVDGWPEIDDGFTVLAHEAAQWVPTTDPKPDCTCDPYGTPDPLCPFEEA